MRSEEPTDSPARSGAPAGEQEPGLSRRSVLRTAAGAGVAGLAASAVAGTVLAAPARSAPARSAPVQRGTRSSGAQGEQGEQGAGGEAQPIVVHLRDAGSGEMDVFAGTSQTRLRDPDLAARLVRAVR